MLNLHIIELEDGKRILYFPKSMRFFTVNEKQAEQYRQIASNMSQEHITPEIFALDEGYSYAEQLLAEKANIEQGKFDTKILPRLVLNISNDCNLRCKYCYASGGNYTGERCLMGIETLERALNSFYACFSEIESIQLFGGEPAMNIAAVEFVCNYLKVHSYSTQIGIVTNGTILPDKLYRLIKAFNIHVTISIDVEALHDDTRPFVSGKGSWHIIQDNIIKLKAIGQPGKLEITYTQQHIDNGISIYDAVNEVSEKFDIKNIHLAPVSSSDAKFHIEDVSCFSESVDDFMLNPKAGAAPYSLLLTMLNTLKTKTVNQYICFAGFGTIAVSASGEVYPCFYFCENKDFLCCSVFDKQDDFRAAIHSMQDMYLSHNRFLRDDCKECFAINVCRGCLGDNFYETGNPHHASKSVCDMTRGMLERLLVNLSSLHNSAKGGA